MRDQFICAPAPLGLAVKPYVCSMGRKNNEVSVSVMKTNSWE